MPARKQPVLKSSPALLEASRVAAHALGVDPDRPGTKRLAAALDRVPDLGPMAQGLYAEAMAYQASDLPVVVVTARAEGVPAVASAVHERTGGAAMVPPVPVPVTSWENEGGATRAATRPVLEIEGSNVPSTDGQSPRGDGLGAPGL